MNHDRWIQRYPAEAPARLRLFCLPYAGGGASLFARWNRSLPRDVELCAVRLPGRETRVGEPPHTRIEPLVETLATAIEPYLDLPFALFGHSMGALVAFELIDALQRRDPPGPVHFFAAGHPAPHLPPLRPPVYLLPDAGFIAYLRHLGQTPDALFENSELLTIYLPVLRADFAVCDTYVYRPRSPLRCPIAAYGGFSDTTVFPVQLDAWRVHTTGRFSLTFFPGDHFFLHQSSEALLRAIGEELYATKGPR